MSLYRLSLACLLVFAGNAGAREYTYSDAHLHYVDFFQETAGMPKLLTAMKENSIEHVMISGSPVAKKWHEVEPKRPRYYAGDDADAYWYSATDVIVADAVQKLTPEQRPYFHPFCQASTLTTRTPPRIFSACSNCIRACGKALAKCSHGMTT